MRGVSTVPPPPPSPALSCLPPLDEHATMLNAITPAPASTASRFNAIVSPRFKIAVSPTSARRTECRTLRLHG
jgi:hypothetical protein